ncbi:MAG: glutamate 5-kinase [Candidatus Dormibacteria bacterium]
MIQRPVTTVVVKVGSSSLTAANGALSSPALDSIVRQLVDLSKGGVGVLLVTSGAIAAGRGAIGTAGRGRGVDVLQSLAAVGQGMLMEEYARRFREHETLVAQVLLTGRDFGERKAYLNARSTFTRLLQWRVVPIVNENDTVATDEITFGENDRLAALVATLLGADLLLILTDTPGVFSADPHLNAEASLVDEVTSFDASLEAATRSGPGSDMGSGGMASKIAAARIAAWSGIPCVIAGAATPGVIGRVVGGEPLGTRVLPKPTRMPARKVWIAFAQAAKGRVSVDDGAVQAICRQGHSLLPVGVRAVVGDFEAGEAVEICDARGVLIAKGLSSCSADRLRTLSERSPGDERCTTGAAVHRDDLVVLMP